MDEQQTEIQINTPEGVVYATESDGGKSEQTITLVTGDALVRLRSLGADGTDFVRRYVVGTSQPTLEEYDVAFQMWQQDQESEFTNQQVIETIGGYLGNKCIDELGMEWCIMSDEYGTDYAIRSTKVEVTSYPFSAVLKRIEEGHHGFIHGLYNTIKHTIETSDLKARE